LLLRPSCPSMEQQFSAEQSTLKNEGNAFVQASDYTNAVAVFTKALNLPGGSREGLAILYSNRCAARMGMGDYVAALSDAEHACENNAAWNKAWARKGAALLVLERFREAADAYDKAAMLSGADSPFLTEYFIRKQECLNRLKGEAKPSSGRRNPPAQRNGDSVYPPTPMAATLQPWVWQRDVPTYALRLSSVVCALLYTFGAHPGFFAVSMLAQTLAMFVVVLQVAGRPRWNVAWAELALSQPQAIPGLLCLTFSSYDPIMIALLCIQCISIGAFLRQTRALVERIPMLADWLPQRMDALLTRTYPEAASPAAMWSNLEDSLQKHGAKFELSLGAALLLKLLSPERNLVSVLLFTQTIKMRYFVNAPTRETFAQLDAFLQPLAQRMGAAGMYARVQQAAKAYVTPPTGGPAQPPQQGGGRGGLGGMFASAASSCSVQ